MVDIGEGPQISVYTRKKLVEEIEVLLLKVKT